MASVFSPSSIGVGGSVQGPLSTSQTGLTDLFALLHHSGYRVEIANTTQQESALASTKGAVFLLIDPDVPINSSLAQTLYSGYQDGRTSLVLAEGNSTNEAPLLTLLGARVTGAAINDTASPFTDQRVFDLTVDLGTPVSGVMDVASPIVISSPSALSPAGLSPPTSIDAQNSTMGPRTVVAAGLSPASSRAVLVSSASPFTNCGLSACKNLNDTALDLSIVNWASGGNTSRPVVVDASRYVSKSLPFSLGLPVGWIMLLLLSGALSVFGGSGLGLSSGSGTSLFGFLIPPAFGTIIEAVFAVLLLLFIRNRIRAWFAPEKPVKDDQPLPSVEKEVVAQSRERLDFLSTSRNRSFYVATLAQLYEVIDDVSRLEFGKGAEELSPEVLAPRLGPEKSALACSRLRELSRYYRYASSGKGRFIIPPGLSWKRKVAGMTVWAEGFLNDLGMTMSGKPGSGQQVEYALKR